jgi:DNA-binding protein HU-beta
MMTTDAKNKPQSSARDEIIKHIAKETKVNQDNAKKALDAALACISESLKDGKIVRLIGFGTFSVQDKAASTGRNPRTGEPIEIAASKRLVFKAGKELKEAINPDKAPKKAEEAHKKTAKKK